jgi:adenylate cyclase
LERNGGDVDKFVGDVDKFVGDEVMALFDGQDAISRAVRCALEMVEATSRVENAKAKGMGGVGVGIFVGEVIHGPIGSKNRMDFTVIGDVVNTAARLCSAAQKGQVLVGIEVARVCEKASDLRITALAPLVLKGKKEPSEVAQVERMDSVT